MIPQRRASFPRRLQQLPIPPRLTPQILRRRLHRRAKMRGRVPGPARVLEDRAGDGDQVGIAVVQDRLGMLELGDQAHRHNRDLDCGFDPT